MLVLLAAAPGAPPPPPVLASPDFQTVNVPADVARFANEHLAQELTARGLRVVTARDINALLGMERQRQLAGCAEGQAACLTELANALGADGLLLGDLAWLGGRWQLNLKVIRSSSGTRVASHSATLTRESELVPELTRAAAALAPAVLAGFGHAGAPLPAPAAHAAPGRRRWPLWPTVAAGVLAAGGGASLVVSESAHAKLRDAAVPLSEAQGRATADRGRRFQTLGWVGLGGAAATLAATGVWYALSGDAAQAAPAVTGVPGAGATLGVAGRLP